MMRTMKIGSMSAGVAMAIVAMADCRTNTLVSGISDWTSPASYVDTSFVPGPGDAVIIPSGGGTVYLDATDRGEGSSWALADSLSAIIPRGTSSQLIVTVPEGVDVDFNPSFTIYGYREGNSAYTSTGSAYKYGTLVKRGSGALWLKSIGTACSSNKASCYDYFSSLTLEEGTVYLPRNYDDEFQNCYLGRVVVSNGATLFTASRDPGKSSNFGRAGTLVVSLHGSGLVTNDTVASANNGYFLEVLGKDDDGTSVFSGRIDGTIRVYSTADLTITTPDNRAKGPSTLNGGRQAVTRIGDKNGSASLGAGDHLYVRAPGGRLEYLGTGETVGRTFGFEPTTSPFIIDAGATGGLLFTNAWENYYQNTKSPKMRNLVLTGSNTVPCVVDVKMETASLNVGGTNVTCYMVKEGSGTWRFKDGKKHVNDNGFWVKEGTLQFDSLRAKGVVCALGVATNLTDGYIGDFDSSRTVDYAFKLGSEITSGSSAGATLEYTGIEDVQCLDRPFVLVGDASVKNDTSCSLCLGDVRVLNPGKKTITLDGSGDGEFHNLMDGAGILSVKKEGAGTWTLSGDLSFSGDVSANGGRLIIRPQMDSRYSWYRWTIRQLQGEDTSKTVKVEEFGLFSAGTNRQLVGYVENPDYRRLQPGEVAIQSGLDLKYVSGTTSGNPYTSELSHLFDNNNTYGLSADLYRRGSTSQVPIVPDDPNTHLVIWMRLTNNAPEVTSFDYVNVYGTGNSSAKFGVKSYVLEGSVNGLDWDELYTTNNAPLASASWYWTSSNKRFNANETRANTSGYPIRGRSMRIYAVPENIGVVSVAEGATLETEGGELEISKLRVDATGAGTLRGFSFAENGTLDVVNFPVGVTVMRLPGVYDSVAGFENIGNWNLTLQGQVKPSIGFRVTDGSIMVFRPGTQIHLR